MIYAASIVFYYCFSVVLYALHARVALRKLHGICVGMYSLSVIIELIRQRRRLVGFPPVVWGIRIQPTFALVRVVRGD